LLRLRSAGFLALLAALNSGLSASAQTRTGTAAAAPVATVDLPFAYDGPPPPVPPATISRDETGRATVRAVRLTMPLRLDGKLDEAVYEMVPPISDFIQTEPVLGVPPSQKTEVWVLYDDDNFYIAGRCWEAHLEKMVINEMRRDANGVGQNDRLGFVLDTFYDRRNGISFNVTPIGGRNDGQVTDERQYNGDWNPIWDVATGRFEGGWTAEVVIPFKSLRYRPGHAQIWGINITRNNRWKNEQAYLTPIPKALANRGLFQLSAAATLVGLEAPPQARNLEIKPYAITDLTTDLTSTPRISNDLSAAAGLDVKYGITQSLAADFTYKTDFAQVEADEQQINLTRFNLFFPEKREFFLENHGTFGFGGAAAAFGDASGAGDTPVMFYSRRMGLNLGRQVPLEVGGRVTGRAGRFSVGAMTLRAGAERVSGTVPTTFSVLRIKRDILRRSSVGVIYTDRTIGQHGVGNRAFGADGTFSFFNNLSITTYWARTATDRLKGDDESHRAFLDYAGDRYGLQLERLSVGARFNPEIGFVRRTDIRKHYGLVRFSPRPKNNTRVRRYSYTGTFNYIENGRGRLDLRTGHGEFATEYQNGDRFIAGFDRTYEYLPQPFRIATGITLPVGGYDYGTTRIGYTLGLQRKVSGTVLFERGPFYTGQKTAVTLTRGRTNIRPQLSIEPGLSINHVELDEGTFTAKLITSRVTYSLSPRTFVSALLQYVSSSHTMAANVRLRWEYHPGSELFVVYNEQRDTMARQFPDLANRALIIKVNRLFRF
jgi:hypothetical protein